MSSSDNMPTAQPLRKSAQRLRWFVSAFNEQIARTESETGVCFTLDENVLAGVFAEWLNAFQRQKPDDREEKANYVGFAAGLMLRTLIRKKPLSVSFIPHEADKTHPAYFWAEGYAYVAFCLNVRGLVLEQDFQGHQQLGSEFADTRTWWSFKENVEKDPSLAIAFLDLFAGDVPDWVMPDIFKKGSNRSIAARFYTEQIEGPVDAPHRHPDDVNDS
jgi:hypothetical protein